MADSPNPPHAPDGGAAEPQTYVDGDPGGSARAEFQRRHDKRQTRVQTAHPKVGGLLLKLFADPQATAAWNQGAVGEEVVGGCLNAAAGPLLRVLHDRQTPHSRANIDHIAVTPAGVWVIDAKRYRGRPNVKTEGGILTPRTEKLTVGRRDCARLVDSVIKQIHIVETLLGPAEPAPVHGVLCFVESDWPLFRGSIKTRGVLVTTPKRLVKTLQQQQGDLTPDAVARIWEHLRQSLPGYRR
jgi:hypothetical protein